MLVVNTLTKGSIPVPVVTHCDDATPVMPYDALTLACERRADASIVALPPSDVRDAAVAHGHARARTCTGTGTGSAPAGAEVAPSWSAMAGYRYRYNSTQPFHSGDANPSCKPAALWVDSGCSETTQRHQNNAVARIVVAHASALLNAPGGGESIVGVWDENPMHRRHPVHTLSRRRDGVTNNRCAEARGGRRMSLHPASVV